jgi:hypothetical protein
LLFVIDGFRHVVWKITPDLVANVYAGTGKCDFGGDGGPANKAGLCNPARAAFDASGNLYIADSGNNRIRKVSPEGTISSVAGNGRYAFSGDGGQAASAGLGSPQGLCLDRGGNLYIADTYNQRIRKVTPAGVISTVAGNGSNGFSGDGGNATAASLSSPSGVAVDAAGNIFIADAGNNRIRAVLAPAPAFQVSPGILSFAADSNGNPPATQSITISGSVSGLGYSLSVATSDGAKWLQASGPSGFLPATSQISVSPAGLSAGTYGGTIAIDVPSAFLQGRPSQSHLS